MIEPIIDVSHWQGEIHKETFLGAGALAMYIKAAGCYKNWPGSYTDSKLLENSEKFSSEIPCGYYYFFFPHMDGEKQANFFCDLIGPIKWNLPPAVDVEANPRGVSKSQFQYQLKRFVDVVKKRLRANAVIYTRGYFWNSNVGSPYWAEAHKLWVARYSKYAQHPWGEYESLRPKPWNDFWLWQYSADGNGRGAEFGASGSKSIDINRCNMTKEELYEFADWGDVAPEPPKTLEERVSNLEARVDRLERE